MSPRSALQHTTSVEVGDLMWFDGQKWVKMGSKGAHFTYLCTRNGAGSVLEGHICDPFFGPFLASKCPIFKGR